MIFCNNLKKGDLVYHAVKKRVAEIAMQPRETSATVQVVYEGTKSNQSAPVMDLRLIVDGKPESVPPVDGEPPGFKPKAVLPRGNTLTSFVYPPQGLTPAELEALQKSPRSTVPCAGAGPDVEIGSTTSGRIFVAVIGQSTASVIIDREQAKRVYQQLGLLLAK